MAAYKDLTKEELLELKTGSSTAESVYGDDEHFKQWNRSCL